MAHQFNISAIDQLSSQPAIDVIAKFIELRPTNVGDICIEILEICQRKLCAAKGKNPPSII
jgi:hypothetical protein